MVNRMDGEFKSAEYRRYILNFWAGTLGDFFEF